MAEYAVVKGLRARLTQVDSCGMPIAGPRSRLVTSGFVTVSLSPVMREAEDIEQTNAEGRVCVSDRTPPERKWWEASIEFRGVNTCAISMFTDWTTVVNYQGEDIGFADKKEIPVNKGVALEVWTGIGSDEGCETPQSDDILLTGGQNTTQYGYVLLPVVKEATLGEFEIGASASTFTLSGITNSGARWGRGPYNVIYDDQANQSKRLVGPFPTKSHFMSFKTRTAAPEETTDCCPLILPSPYYGDTSADVAPAQPACDAVASDEAQKITLTSVTAGTYLLSFRGATTSPIAFDATSSVLQSALESLPTVGAGNVAVTGSGPYTVTE